MTRRAWLTVALGAGAVGVAGFLTSAPALPGGRVQVLFTSQVGGSLAPCGCVAGQAGGIPRRAVMLARERVAGGASLLLDAGNFLGQRLPLTQLGFSEGLAYTYHELHNRALARGMIAMGYDAVNLGEKDFLLGQEFLRGLRREGLSLVSCNIVYANPGLGADGKPHRQPFTKPYVTRVIGRGRFLGIPYGGCKVGLFGLAREHSKLAYREGADPNPLTWTSLEESLAEVVRTLREVEHCDLVIGVTQLKAQEAVHFGAKVDGVDLYLAGGDFQPIDKPERGGRAVVVSTEFEGRTIGELMLTVAPGRPVEIERYRTLRLDDAVEEDKTPGAVAARAVQAGIIAEFQQALAARKFAPDVEVRQDGRVAGSHTCAGCHGEEHAHWKDGTRHGSLANFQAHIVDKGQGWNPACLRCHTVGYAHPGGFRSLELDASDTDPSKDRRGVGCESCHGPRSAHVAWQRWQAGHRDPGQDGPPPKVERGPEVRASQCTVCHDKENSPRFDFWRYEKQIIHPDVQRRRDARTAEQDRALGKAPPPPGSGSPPGGADHGAHDGHGHGATTPPK